MPLHRLGGVVVRLEALRHLRRDLGPGRQVRMNEVIEVVEAAGFAEEEVLDVLGEFDILGSLEPD